MNDTVTVPHRHRRVRRGLAAACCALLCAIGLALPVTAGAETDAEVTAASPAASDDSGPPSSSSSEASSKATESTRSTEPTESTRSTRSSASGEPATSTATTRSTAPSSSVPAVSTQTQTQTVVPAASTAPFGVQGTFSLDSAPAVPATPSSDVTGSVTFGVVNFPDAALEVTRSADDGQTVEALPTDTSANGGDGSWVTTDTPYGSVFGANGPSSATRTLRTTVASPATVTTTVSFGAQVAAQLLGVVLANLGNAQVTVQATGTDGNALTADQLGGSTFDFCAVASPPPACTGVTVTADGLPTWDTSLGDAATCRGSATLPSFGSSCWFRPTVALRSLTFTFNALADDGPTSYDLWMATLAARIIGSVVFDDGAPRTDTNVNLVAPDGGFLDSRLVGPSGLFEFGPVSAVDGYRVGLVVPPGYEAASPSELGANLSSGDAVLRFALRQTPQVPAVPVAATRSVCNCPDEAGDTVGSVTLASFGVLPETGGEHADLVAVAALLLLAGAGFRVAGRRRRAAAV